MNLTVLVSPLQGMKIIELNQHFRRPLASRNAEIVKKENNLVKADKR